MLGDGFDGINLIVEGRGQTATQVQALITIAGISNQVQKYAIFLVSALNWASLRSKMLPKCSPVSRSTSSHKFNLNKQCDYVELFKFVFNVTSINIQSYITEY